MTAAQILVMAKQPEAGRVKTRLCPPLTPQQAAAVAASALEDTLDAVRQVDVDQRVLVLDGHFPAAGFDTIPQQNGPFSDRLAAAFVDAWAVHELPMLLVGMDTPQLTEVLLEKAIATLLSPGVDAVLGLAEDGGWWALGLRTPRPELIADVPTSRGDTGELQRRRLVDAGLSVLELPVLRDVDTLADLTEVARLAPDGRFAATIRQVLA